MSRARETIDVPLPPARAEALWADVRRWPSFVEGFKRVVEQAGEWPQPGARVVWDSIPGGRGRVAETVREREPGRRLVTDVEDDAITGRHTIAFAPAGDGTLIELELEYELIHGGPLRTLANALFIRRAISDSLARTLRRYAAEAAEDGADG